MNNVVLKSNEFIPVMQQRFSEGKTVQLTVTGNSMRPFLADKRDSVILSKYNGNAKKGDILLFLRNHDKCVFHRVVKVTDEGIFFLGDGQICIEGSIPDDRILAECHTVIRNGKLIKENSVIWLFFKYIWINIVGLRLPIITLVKKIKYLINDN